MIPQPLAAYALECFRVKEDERHDADDDRAVAADIGRGKGGRNPPRFVWRSAAGRRCDALGTVRFRHGACAIRCIAYSPDGKQLASGGDDDLIRLWDARTGAELHCLAGHGTRSPYVCITTLSFSPDGKILASAGGEDGTVRLWDVATGRLLRTLKHDKEASSVAFFPDGKSLVTSDDGTKRIHFWAVTSGECLRTLDGGKETVWRLSLSPDGKWLATGGLRVVRLWDVASGKPVRALAEQGKWFSDFCFTPDGMRLAVGDDYGGWIYVWDLKRGETIRKIKTPHGTPRKLVFTPDGRTLLSGDSGGEIYRWDMAAKKDPQFLGQSSHLVSSLSVAPDGKALASAGGDNVIRLWDLASGKLLISAKGHEKGIDQLCFAAEDRILLSRDYGIVRNWDLATGTELHREVFFRGNVFDRPLVALFMEGRIMAEGTKKRIRLRDLATKKTLAALVTNEAVEVLSFSRDGKVLAITTANRQVEVWDMSARRRRCRVPGAGYPTLSYNGRWLVTFDAKLLDSNIKRLHIWDAVSGEERGHISGPNEHARLCPSCFSPDNRMFGYREILEDDDWLQKKGTLVVYELRTCQERFRLNGNGGIDAASFSPDGRLLAVGSTEGVIRVLDVPTGEELARFPSGQGRVYSLAFSNAGRTLASGGQDTTILLWPLPLPGPTRPGSPLSAEELPSLWADLAVVDGGRAFRAMRRLYAVPASTVEFLREHLRPVGIPDAERVKRLLADLDADAFAVREEANRQLEQIAEGAEPLLRQALRKEPSLEALRRIRALLEPLAAPSPERWRSAQALEVLEWLNTAETRRLLRHLASGAPTAWLTGEAKAVLSRLDRRAKSEP